MGIGHRTSVSQIRGNRATDIDWQRQDSLPVTFAPDEDLASSPVDVVELQGCHLAAPHAESGEHRQHGEVAAADGGPAIARRQQLLHLSGPERPGQASQTGAGHGGHRRSQGVRDDAVDVQEAKQ